MLQKAESSWLKAYYGELSAQIHRGKALKNLEKAWRIAVSVSERIREIEGACLYPDFPVVTP